MDRALGERRICTVVFCDVAGSTALAESRDPEEWADVMSGAFAALVPAITRYDDGGLAIDIASRDVSLDGSPVHLTPTEFALLARLVRSAGQVVTHRQLLTDVWGAEFAEHTHYLRLYMAQLRAKLEADPADPQRLLTDPGVGYRLIDGEPIR